MSRRSVVPKGRKSPNSTSIAPPDAAVATVSVAPPAPAPVAEPRPRAPAAPLDELAAVDAGWDELLG